MAEGARENPEEPGVAGPRALARVLAASDFEAAARASAALLLELTGTSVALLIRLPGREPVREVLPCPGGCGSPDDGAVLLAAAARALEPAGPAGAAAAFGARDGCHAIPLEVGSAAHLPHAGQTRSDERPTAR